MIINFNVISDKIKTYFINFSSYVFYFIYNFNMNKF